MTTTAMKSLLQAKRNEIKELAWITVSQSNAFERIQENKFLVFKQQQENDNRERETDMENEKETKTCVCLYVMVKTMDYLLVGIRPLL